MKSWGRWAGASALVSTALFVACGGGDADGEPAEGTGGEGGAQPGDGDGDGDASTGGAGGAEDPPEEEPCVDEYPFDDGYTCEEQAGWGKCDMAWLEGYCLVSCDRCDWEPTPQVDLSGPRDVFDTYTEKENLAPTPPMGWNSWNKFACEIDADLIMATADAMVDSGMAAAGYEYVNIDDCWHATERDADGNLQADAIRFPDGMKAVADYVHDLGLKIGIYSDRGTTTCAGYPGSYDHEIQDAETFAEWGIDYLKYDNCAVPLGREEGAEMEEDYAIMGEALRQSGRPIVYSVCAWWFYDWMPEVGHLWRTTTDIKDNWNDDKHGVISLTNWSGGTTERYGEFSEDDFESGAYPAPGLAEYAGPSAWNDPDMLEVGNGGMTDEEYRAHFSLWAIMAAPLIAGNDLRDMSPETLAILTNPDVIAVNQDPLGVQGVPVSESTTLEVWAKELSGDDTYAALLFNRTDEEAEIIANFEEIGLEATTATVRNLWTGTDEGTNAGSFSAVVPGHGVVMITLTGQP